MTRAISAKVVLDSVNRYGKRITTLETLAPKLIDAEFEKHRMLSSNSSSSRALPFKVDRDPYLPSDLRKKEGGMQGYISADPEWAKHLRMVARNMYYEVAYRMEGMQDIFHKQHLNWYTDPWAWQIKVVTATEWDNFFALRLKADVRPEMRMLAYAMDVAMNGSYPVQRNEHIPYLEEDDVQYPVEQQKLISAGRCANASFRTPEKGMMPAWKSVDLAKRLLKSGHMTPFEHQAHSMRWMDDDVVGGWESGVSHIDRDNRLWSGNFHGWIQNRKVIEYGYRDSNST